LFLLGFGCAAWGQSPVRSEFPFQFRDGLIWVQVSVPQSRQPLQFLLDTGAGVSVINLRTAKRLHLRLGRPVWVEGVETESKGFWPQSLRGATVGSVELCEEYLAVDLGRLSQACQRGVDGLVGADFFSRHVVQIDFAARLIRVGDTPPPCGGADVVRLEYCGGGMRVPVQVNGGAEQWVRLDTGCVTVLEWVTSNVMPGGSPVEMAVALTGFSRPMAQASLRLGKSEFGSVPAGLHAHELFAGESGLIGNGVLNRFSSVTIDVPGGRLTLEKRLAWPEGPYAGGTPQRNPTMPRR
jgi:hypothetical protein